MGQRPLDFSQRGRRISQTGGTGSKLKPGSSPRFWHPHDPVLVLAGLHRGQKHGEDGRFQDDGKLACRLPGTGIQIAGQRQITVAALQAKGVNLDPCGPFKNVPAIASLVHEAFLADPLNAPPSWPRLWAATRRPSSKASRT